jgi:hypothetical protein
MQPAHRPSWATGSAAGADDDGYVPSTAPDSGLLSLTGAGLRLHASRSSDGTGGSSDDVTPLSGSRVSSTSGSSVFNVSVSGVVTAVQRGVSRAGRSVSGAVARLSMPGLSGYERLVNTVNLTQPGSQDAVGPASFAGGPPIQQQQQLNEVELQSTSGYRQSLAAQETGRQPWEAEDVLLVDDADSDGFFLPVSAGPRSAALPRPHSPSAAVPAVQGPGGGPVRGQAGLSA